MIWYSREEKILVTIELTKQRSFLYDIRLSGERRCESKEKYLLDTILNMQEIYIDILFLFSYLLFSFGKHKLEMS